MKCYSQIYFPPYKINQIKIWSNALSCVKFKNNILAVGDCIDYANTVDIKNNKDQPIHMNCKKM